MSSFVVKNNVESTIDNHPLSSGDLILNVPQDEGSKFPSTFPYRLTIWDDLLYRDPSDDSNMEIVECTSRISDALTIIRGKENTIDVAHANGSRVAMLITAGIFDEKLGSDSIINGGSF